MTCEQLTEATAAATVEFLHRCGVSDHAGEGITASTVADHFDVATGTAGKYLRRAADDGVLETRPAVTLHDPGMATAYVPQQ